MMLMPSPASTVVLYALSICSLAAQSASTAPPMRDQVASVFTRYNNTDSPGCAVGVSRNDRIVIEDAYGMADLEHRIALSADSIIEAGSVSKQFTAAALLLLAGEGKISLDDPVRKYIPELPDYGAPLTIRHMMHHTSGLRDWGSLADIAGWPRTTRAYTHEHVVEIVSRQRSLNYPPGQHYSYSNTGYNLAAILVSRVAGKPFAEYTRDAIFLPLGMKDTSWRDDYRRIVPRRATAYFDGARPLRTLMPFENVHGNGGLLTTVGDLLRWNANFASRQVGGAALVESQQTKGKLNDGTTLFYGAGLMLGEFSGEPEISHSGATAGYRAWLARYPRTRLSVAVLCNAASADAPGMGRSVAALFLGKSEAGQPGAAAADPAPWAGRYRSSRDSTTIVLEVSGGALRGRGVAWQPAGERVFRAGNRTLTFANKPGGNAVQLTFADPSGTHLYVKVDPWTPSPEELQRFTGEYNSNEAGVTLRVELEDGALVLHRSPATRLRLTPRYRNGFEHPALGSVRFLPEEGRISEMSIGSSRLWDLRLQRLSR